MKKILFLFAVLFTVVLKGQTKENPLVILDAKKLGFMQDVQKEIEAINPDDIATVTIYKDSSVSKIYQSEQGVMVITTKKFILTSFYQKYISDSPLKEQIKSSEDLLKIGVVTDNPKSKNQPYDELSKYIDTYTITQKILAAKNISFINPKDSMQINPDWKFGAIQITPKKEDINLYK